MDEGACGGAVMVEEGVEEIILRMVGLAYMKYHRV